MRKNSIKTTNMETTDINGIASNATPPTKEQLMEEQYFHIFLLKYYYNSTTKQEQKNQKDTDYLNFEFGPETYTIQFLDLKLKADKETNLLKINQYPLLKIK